MVDSNPKEDMPSVSRIYPERVRADAGFWYSTLAELPAQCVCLQFGRHALQKVVLFIASLHRRVWGCLLSDLGGRKLSWDLSRPFHELFVPVERLLVDAGFQFDSEDVTIYSLEVSFCSIDKTEALFRVAGAEKVECKRAASSEPAETVEDSAPLAEDDAELDMPASDLESWDFSGRESASEGDVESLESGFSSAEESETLGVAPAREAAPMERAAPGTFVAQNNPYFSVSNYFGSSAKHASASLRARVAERWGTDAFLGKETRSKTIQIRDFDVNPASPTISRQVLQPWMLYRVQANDFLRHTSCRREWYDRELARFKGEVAQGTPSAKANALIASWIPGIFG